MPIQFYGYLKTAKQLKSNMSRRYKTRSLKNPFQNLFVEGKPKNFFLAVVDVLGDFATFPVQQEEYDQVRMTIADALHPTVNTNLSETIMPAAMPKKLIQFQPMYNIFNSIGVPTFVQRSPWLEPLCTQNLGAPANATRNWFGFYRYHNNDIMYRCAFNDPSKTALMEGFAKERGMAARKYRIEDWREPKTNLDSQTFMSRMRDVQQIEKEDKKRHDAKIDTN